MKKYSWMMVLLLILTSAAIAQEADATAETVADEPQAESVTTQHSVVIDGNTMRYSATARLALIRNDIIGNAPNLLESLVQHPTYCQNLVQEGIVDLPIICGSVSSNNI